MGLAGIVAEIGRSLADFVFPPLCFVCDDTAGDDRLLCSSCRNDIRRQALDYTCEKEPPAAIDGVTVLLPYDDRCRSLVHGLKYNGFSKLGPELGELIGEKTLRDLDIGKSPIVIPTPLHHTRLRERGYNQSERLARGFVAASDGIIAEDILVRTRDTGTQTALDAAGRATNVRNAFAVRENTAIDGETVVLIDDVMTTGSTLSECADILKEAGAARVYACVAASPTAGHD